MNHRTRLLTSLALWLLVIVAHAGTVTYVYTDPQGTPLAEADANGNITARFDYTPYGQSVASMGAAPNGPGYTGHVNDPDTGLVYMQARYYDPVVGRFLSIDPVGPSPGNTFNFNRYGYASNNPIINIDPDGRNGVTAFGGLLAESWNFAHGEGFNGAQVWGALKDGYNGEGAGITSSALQDATFIPAGVVAGAAIKVARLASATINVAKLARANKIVHIFSQERHNLAGVAKALGGESKAFTAIQKATSKAIDTSKAGRFSTIVKVGGEQVTVRGSVVDGRVKIGTAFVEKELKK